MKPRTSALTNCQIETHPLLNKVQRQEYKKLRDRAVRENLGAFTALEFADHMLMHVGRLMGTLGNHPALVSSRRRTALLYVFEALKDAGLPITVRGFRQLMRQLETGGSRRGVDTVPSKGTGG